MFKVRQSKTNDYGDHLVQNLSLNNYGYLFNDIEHVIEDELSESEKQTIRIYINRSMEDLKDLLVTDIPNKFGKTYQDIRLVFNMLCALSDSLVKENDNEEGSRR